MIRVAFVGNALDLDSRRLTSVVATPVEITRVPIGSSDALWTAAIADQDLVLVGQRGDREAIVVTVREMRASTTAAVVVVGMTLDGGKRVELLDAGADDVIVAPVDLVELGARIRGILQRTMPGVGISPVEWIGGYAVSCRDRRAWELDSERRLQLSPIQWQVLARLLESPGRTVQIGELQEQVWGEQDTGRESYVRQYIVQLRRKLERDPRHPRHLLTDHGRGYRFER